MPQRGTIRIQGNDINDYDAVQLRDKIGVVMQKAVLFAGTIADNLRWGKNDATEEEMWKALDIAQATEVVKQSWAAMASEAFDLNLISLCLSVL